ncbi:hypothetical protein EIK56_23775 [Sphingomonas sp. C8-2]|nr:hypothetical protein EIK56_23775 [Sphingomonas sp. C8-2]
MTADAGAGSRIAASDDEIHPLTLEGPSCGGFSRPAAARTGYVVLRIEPGGRAARLAPGGLPAPSRRSPGRWGYELVACDRNAIPVQRDDRTLRTQTWLSE